MTTLTTYIGTKIIQATPMLGAPGNPQTAGVAGYQVVYEDGYTSWSPADVFERAYRRTDRMSFGDALVMLEAGKKVARAGWNGKGMWISLSCSPTLHPVVRMQVPAMMFWSENNANYALEQGGFAEVLPCITMKTADGSILMGWLASQTDMLAKDWQVVE